MEGKPMHITTIDNLVGYVQNAGRMAFREQKKGMLKRRYKDDGTVITSIDTRVENYLHARITKEFPDANILSEETTRFFDEKKPYTFVLDPIDGTDVYSQGMRGWCIALGLMKDFQPVAGMLYSPGLDLFLYADLGRKVSLKGQPLMGPGAACPITARTNLVATSSLHRKLDLRKFPGKIRSIGSAALHLCFPLVYPEIYATLENDQAHIWDILASHAICRSMGLDLEYFGGDVIEYQALTDGRPIGDLVLCGPVDNLKSLRNLLIRVI